MNKLIKFFGLLMIFMLAVGINSADAQSRKKKKKKKTSKTDEYFNEDGDFVTKLWFGADLKLNFSSGQVSSLPANQFNFGFAPMAGYKIKDWLSVGPRLEFANQALRVDVGQAENLKINSLNIGAGVFVRAKIMQQFFIHGEYQVLSVQTPETIDTQTLEVESRRDEEIHPFLGVGYHSPLGGLFGYQAYVLWDFSEQFTANNIPIEVRLGVNYNF